MKRIRMGLTTTLAASAAFLLTAQAEARPWVPAELQKIIGMPCAPGCTLCHDSPQGGGPADKPFGIEIQTAGFFPSANESAASDQALACAVSTLDPTLSVPLCPTPPAVGGAASDGGVAPPTTGSADADKNGVNDIQQLKAGIDPDGGGGNLCGPTYGCVRVAPRGHVDGVATVAGVVALLAGIGAFRRRGRFKA